MVIDHGLRRVVLRTLLPAFRGHTAPDWALRLAEDGVAGFILYGYNIAGDGQLRSLTRRLREAGPEVLLSTDEEGGDVTRLAHTAGSPYPGNAALGAVDDPALTERIYRAIGLDLATAGFHLDFAPSLDVNTADDNPVIGTRSFGADPGRVAEHAAASVTGLQSAGIVAAAKHFPGHGATIVDSHLALPTVDVPVEVLRDRDLVPFAAAVKAGARAVMTAHIRVPALTGALPATFSSRALGDLLRGELGFAGTVVTDALEMRGAADIAGGVPGGAVLALAAGADLLCLGSRVDEALVEATLVEVMAAVRDGRLATSRLDDAAARVDSLVTWVSEHPPVAVPAGDERIGYAAAARAVRVEGTVPALDEPLILQVESESSIAAGPVPWGLGSHVDGVVRVPATSSASTALASVPGGARSRPIVVVGRNLHRQPGAPELVEGLAAGHPVVVVEMGWPGMWRPSGVRAFVATYGASRANGWAAASALGLA